jgi:hypothetical protein
MDALWYEVKYHIVLNEGAHLLELAVRYSISVDDDALGFYAFVVLAETLEQLLELRLHAIHHFLAVLDEL